MLQYSSTWWAVQRRLLGTFYFEWAILQPLLYTSTETFFIQQVNLRARKQDGMCWNFSAEIQVYCVIYCIPWMLGLGRVAKRFLAPLIAVQSCLTPSRQQRVQCSLKYARARPIFLHAFRPRPRPWGRPQEPNRSWHICAPRHRLEHFAARIHVVFLSSRYTPLISFERADCARAFDFAS